MKWNERFKIFVNEFKRKFFFCMIAMVFTLFVMAFGSYAFNVMPSEIVVLILILTVIIASIIYAICETRNKCKTKD